MGPRPGASDSPLEAGRTPALNQRTSVRIALSGRRRALLAVFLLLSGVYLYWSVNAYRAARLAQGVSEEALTAAVRLQPGNAEYHFRLGSFLFLGRHDLEPALDHMREAVALNPRDAHYWLALANLYQVTGDSSAQLQALQHATAASPNDPTVAWQAANYHLVRGEMDRALAQFQVVLLHDPGMAELALELCWRGTRDVARIVALLDERPELHLVLLRVLLAQEAPAAAADVWNRLLALQRPFRMERALPYINRLIERGAGEPARAAWNGALALQPGMEAHRHGRNLIVNGGFDENILNGGFDWRVGSPEGVRVRVDSTEFHNGHRSLAVEYLGEETLGGGIVQFVPLRPSREYVFTVHYKTLKLVGTNAPQLFIQQHPGGRTLAATSPLEAAPVWRREQVRFRTGAETGLVAIRMRRPSAATLLRGTIFLDNVSLQEAAAGESSRAR